MKSYIVVHKDLLPSLEKEVEAKMRLGYEPVGGISILVQTEDYITRTGRAEIITYYQAMQLKSTSNMTTEEREGYYHSLGYFTVSEAKNE